jgi:uncharacterized protein
MEADRWIDRVTSQKTHLPEQGELALVEDELRNLVARLKETQASEAPLRQRYEEAKTEADRLRKRTEEIDKALMSPSASARDLASMQKELEHIRSTIEEIEDREITALMELEPFAQAIEEIKKKAQPLATRRGELQATISELVASLDEELTHLRESRAQLASAVASAQLARYEKALTRSGASGAANVDAGRCDGCRIALSPLDADRFKSLPADTLMDCPECGRILLP